jgi:AcrR family transcriptional regulator
MAAIGRVRVTTADTQHCSTRWEAKETQILAAAEGLFMTRGYSRTSMDAIAREAGVSKQTLYHHHGSKEALFAAIVDARADCLLLSLNAEELSARSPHAALTELGRHFLDIVLSPSSLGLHRAIVTEVPRQPELGRLTYERGPRRAVETLAWYLSKLDGQGRLRVPDSQLAAEQFYGMLLGFMQIRALFAVDGKPSPERIERAVSAAVDSFMAAHTP